MTSTVRWRVAALLGTTIASFTGRAAGQPAEKAAAEALFSSGRELLERGQVEEACRAFEASQKLEPAIGTALHLGDCYERSGRTASAWAAFREAASVAQASGQVQRQEIAETRLRALEPRLAHIEPRIAPQARLPGLVVRLGEVTVPAASWGLAIPVDPGRHLVRASAPGHVPWSTTVHVSSQPVAHVLEVPSLTPLPPPVVVAPVPDTPRRPLPPRAPVRPGGRPDDGATPRAVGLVVGGVGLGTLALASIFGVQAITTNDASLARCRAEDPSLCSARGVAMREEAASDADVSTALFVVGGGLLAGGIVLVLTAPQADQAPRIGRLGPVVASDGGGMLVGGAF